MFRLVIILFSSLLLSACVGSAYKLPQVNQADVVAAQNKIAKRKPDLKVYERSDSKNRQMLASISKRLERSAKPLCKHAGYDSCYFQTSYNPEATVNAYASEGYKITIYRGLLQYLKNEDEIAAVVAHEMGHHLAKHNEESMQNAAAGAAVSGLVTAVLLGSGSTYYNPYQQQQNQQTIENMMNMGASIGARSYSKEQEREADLLATYLLSRAGYNLKNAQNVMVVLSEFSGENRISQSAFLDTHPAGIDRYVAWDMAIQEVKNNSSKLPYLKEEPTKKSKK